MKRESHSFFKNTGFISFFHRIVKKRNFVCALCLLMAISLPGCSLGVNQIIDQIQADPAFPMTNTTPLNDEDFILLLLSGITENSNEQIQIIYEKIPNAQLGNLSFSAFDSYIKALRRMLDRRINSFSFPSGEEKENLLADVQAIAPGDSDLIAISVPIKLYGPQEDSSFYVYFQRNASGNLCFSSLWVEKCLSIYQYAALYFKAIKDQNQAAVEALLTSALVPEIDGNISSMVIDYKAREILSYYQRQVREDSENFLLKSMNISQLTFEQRNFYPEDSDQPVPREIHFIRRSPKIITVKDTISSPLRNRDITVYRESESLSIQVGADTSTDILKEKLGDPLIVSAGMPDAEGKYNIVVGYSSLLLTVYGQFDDENSIMSGQIRRIRLRTNDESISMGGYLFSGMELDSLLRRYPFADLEDYALLLEEEDRTYRMTFSIDPENWYITGINLELVPAE